MENEYTQVGMLLPYQVLGTASVLGIVPFLIDPGLVTISN